MVLAATKKFVYIKAPIEQGSCFLCIPTKLRLIALHLWFKVMQNNKNVIFNYYQMQHNIYIKKNL